MECKAPKHLWMTASSAPLLWRCGGSDDSRFTPSDDAFVDFEGERATVVGTAEGGDVVVGSTSVNADGCLEVGSDCVPVNTAGCDLESGP